MWHIYGNEPKQEKTRENEKRDKIIISLNADSFYGNNNYYDDYLILLPENKKVYKQGDFSYDDLRALFGISWFNKIKYRSKNNSVFKKNYMSQPFKGIPRYHINTSTLGKYKTKSWLYEDEVRLLFHIWPSCRTPYEKNYLLLRLKDKFFNNMRIIVSPWDNDGRKKQEIENLILNSDLNDDIKNTIEVIESTETQLFE